MIARLQRWWATRKLAHLDWPDPEGSIDWLEHRRAVLERERDR